MSCRRHESALFLHAHGQLGALQRWFLEAHLQTCPSCRSKWAQWVVEKDRLRRAFSPMPGPEAVGSQLLTSVGARIRGERQDRPATAVTVPAEPPSRARLAMVAAAAALLALAVAAAAGYWSPRPSYSGALENCVVNAPAAAKCAPTIPANAPGKKQSILRPTPSAPKIGTVNKSLP